jgi:uncharacterized protein YdaL
MHYIGDFFNRIVSGYLGCLHIPELEKSIESALLLLQLSTGSKSCLPKLKIRYHSRSARPPSSNAAEMSENCTSKGAARFAMNPDLALENEYCLEFENFFTTKTYFTPFSDASIECNKNWISKTVKTLCNIEVMSDDKFNPFSVNIDRILLF